MQLDVTRCIFAYPMKLDISTKNTVTKILRANFFSNPTPPPLDIVYICSEDWPHADVETWLNSSWKIYKMHLKKVILYSVVIATFSRCFIVYWLKFPRVPEIILIHNWRGHICVWSNSWECLRVNWFFFVSAYVPMNIHRWAHQKCLLKYTK